MNTPLNNPAKQQGHGQDAVGGLDMLLFEEDVENYGLSAFLSAGLRIAYHESFVAFLGLIGIYYARR